MTQRSLSPTEAKVASLLAAGHTDKSIRATLRITQQRVSTIIRIIAEKWQLDQSQNVRIQIAQRASAA